MLRFTTVRIVALAALTLISISSNALAQSSTDFFDVTQTSINVSSHTPTIGSSNNNLPGSDAIYNIFGGGNSGVEANDRALFADFQGTAFVNFTRSSNSTINTITLYEASDGAVEGAQRGVSNFTLYADTSGNGQYNAVLLPISDPLDNGSANTYVIPTNNFTSFRAEFTPPSGPGSRVFEMDATFNPAFTDRTYRDQFILNANTNVTAEGDQPAGLVNSVTASSAIGGGTDDPKDAFGNNNGTVEPDTFIFGGTGDQTLDFTTASPVTLYGIAPNTRSDDGSNDGFRGTSRFQFFADLGLPGFGDDTALVDVNPTDDGLFDMLRFSAPITASSFRAVFTSSNGESRVIEIDGIVPEPATFGLLLVGGLGLLLRRRTLRRAG